MTLSRLTLFIAASALSRECRRGSEARNLDRLIDNADALVAVARELDKLDPLTGGPVTDWREISREVFSKSEPDAQAWEMDWCAKVRAAK